MTRHLCLLMTSLSAAGVALFGCAEEEPENVVWTCSCSWVRDGMEESTEVGGGCGGQDDAQSVADEATAQCQAELDLVCSTDCQPCSCRCDPGDEECTPS